MAIQDVVEPAMVVGVSGIYGSYLLCVEYLQISFALLCPVLSPPPLTVRGTAPSGCHLEGATTPLQRARPGLSLTLCNVHRSLPRRRLAHQVRHSSGGNIQARERRRG